PTKRNSAARPGFHRRCNCSIRNYLPTSLARRCVRYVLVLDNRLRSSIRQPGSSRPSVASSLLQRKGSNWGRLADLDAGWNWTRFRFVDPEDTYCHNFPAWLPIVFCIGAMPGILFSIALFYFRASSCVAACRRGHQQIVRSHCRSINDSPIYSHLDSRSYSCFALSLTKERLFRSLP